MVMEDELVSTCSLQALDARLEVAPPRRVVEDAFRGPPSSLIRHADHFAPLQVALDQFQHGSADLFIHDGAEPAAHGPKQLSGRIPHPSRVKPSLYGTETQDSSLLSSLVQFGFVRDRYRRL